MEAVVAVPNQKACRQKGVCLQWKACVCNGRCVSLAELILKLFAFYLAAEFRRP